ncbi:MAG: DNA recombination protein RmuC [Muribaculaceae bacterium]|nr:DNA recombination protein RmuC [Muribaculaceae bacterium]
MIEIIIAVVAVLIGFALGFLFSNSGKSGLATQNQMLSADKERLESELVKSREEYKTLTDERATYLSQVVSLESQLKMTAENAQSVREELEQQLQEVKSENQKRLDEMKADHEKRLAEQREAQSAQLQEQLKLVTEQMNTATQQFLKQRSEELTNVNREQLGNILTPLQENIKQMREAVEKSDREQLQTMTRLDTAIKENLKSAQEVGERADRLAQALVGDNKKQGDFGEMKLRQLLENMGLEEGVQFEEQVTLRDENGKVINTDAKYRPDVILHFPDNRDLIIDSKMSLTAYEHYFNADTDDQKERALKEHLASVKQHVKELATKGYQNQVRNGKNHLDFVVMYMFNESALQLALAQDPRLWQEAFEAGVMIVSPQNMYALLRVLEFTWKQDRQVKNQRDMMDAANAVVERVQMFYERFVKVKDALKRTSDAFTELETTVSPSGRSIVVSARKLLKYGAKESTKHNQLPREDSEEIPLLDSGDERN